jgi:hypothetical protein
MCSYHQYLYPVMIQLSCHCKYRVAADKRGTTKTVTLSLYYNAEILVRFYACFFLESALSSVLYREWP